MKWTEEEIIYLKKHYVDTKNDDIAKYLGRTNCSITKKALKLGIRKPQEYIDNYKKSPYIKYNYNHYSIDDLKKISQKYKNRTDFRINDPRAHTKASRMGKLIYDEICSHMINQACSTPQLILAFILKKLLGNNYSFNDRSVIKPYEIDIYYSDFNLGFEYDGKNWHNRSINKNDKIKDQLCIDKNITLIRIKENDRNNIELDIKNKIISKIKIINSVTGFNIKEEQVNNIKLVYTEIYENLLSNELIISTVNKYAYYTDFKRNENSLYRKLQKRKILHNYTSHLIRSNNDKHKYKFEHRMV